MTFSQILIVEDDPDDMDFLSHALAETGAATYHIVSTAGEALEYLRQADAEDKLPLLIISDLNMPACSGLELLQILKSKEPFKHIPVVICSTSNYHHDVFRCRSLGAKEYFTKSAELSLYYQFARQMHDLVVQEMQAK